MADSKDTKNPSPLKAIDTESTEDPCPELPNISPKTPPDQEGGISKEGNPDVPEDNDQDKTDDPNMELSQPEDPSLRTERMYTESLGSLASSLRKVDEWQMESQLPSAQTGQDQKISGDHSWRDVPSIIQSDSSSLYQISDSQTLKSGVSKTPTGLQRHLVKKLVRKDTSGSDSLDCNIRKDLQTMHIESGTQSPEKISIIKESRYDEQACWFQHRDVPPIITSDSSEQTASTKTSSHYNIPMAGLRSLDNTARRELEDLEVDSDPQLAEKRRLIRQQEKQAKQQQPKKQIVRMDTLSSLDSEDIFGEMEDEPVYDREPIDIDPTYLDTSQQHKMECLVPITISTEPMSSCQGEKTEAASCEEKSVATLEFPTEPFDDSDQLALKKTNKKKLSESSPDFMDLETPHSEAGGCKALLSSSKMDIALNVEDTEMSVEMPVSVLCADALGDSDPLKKDSLEKVAAQEQFNLPSAMSLKLPASSMKVSDDTEVKPTICTEKKLISSHADNVRAKPLSEPLVDTSGVIPDNIERRRPRRSSSEALEIQSKAMRTRKLSTDVESPEKAKDASLQDFAAMIAKGVQTVAKKVCQAESPDILPDSQSTRKSCQPETPDIIPFSLSATKSSLSGSSESAKDKRKRKSEDTDISTFTPPKKISESKELLDITVESPEKRMSLMPLVEETMGKQSEISPEKQSRKRKSKQLSESEETKSQKLKSECRTQIPEGPNVSETKLSPVHERRKSAKLSYEAQTSQLSRVKVSPTKKTEKD